MFVTTGIKGRRKVYKAAPLASAAVYLVASPAAPWGLQRTFCEEEDRTALLLALSGLLLLPMLVRRQEFQASPPTCPPPPPLKAHLPALNSSRPPRPSSSGPEKEGTDRLQAMPLSLVPFLLAAWTVPVVPAATL